MNREERIEYIKRNINCKDYLLPSRDHKYACPFCGSGNGKKGTSALQINKNNTYYCHSCEKHGDTIDAYMELYNCDFNTAIDNLCPASDSIIPATTYKKPKNRDESTQKTRVSYKSYIEECNKRLQETTDSNVLGYLEKRGISLPIALKYGIGYDSFSSPATNPGISSKSNVYPVPRLIIPSSDFDYVGRRIDGISEYEKINAKGTSPSLFNMDALYQDDIDKVFIVEGAMDALSILQAGFPAVSLNSTSNVSLLLERCKSEDFSKKEFLVALDNDDAGKRASTLLLSGLKELSIKAREVDVCGIDKDPNAALVRDAVAFKDTLQKIYDEDEVEKTDFDLFFEKIQTDCYRPLNTGLPFFDRLLDGGIMRQSMLLLMAAPATGKTTFCQQLAETMAVNEQDVIYLNFEMSKEQLWAKSLSADLYNNGHMITAKQVLQGYQWNEEQKDIITKSFARYKENNYAHIRYNPEGLTNNLENILGYLEGVGEEFKSKGRPGPIVFIDYLHLISSSKYDDIQTVLKQAMAGLKSYAKKFDTSVIAVAASNRMSNGSGILTMESGRDSSNLEYGADYCLTMNYYMVDNDQVKPSDVEKLSNLQSEEFRRMIFRCLKCRVGKVGNRELVYFHTLGNRFIGANGNEWTDKERPSCALPFEKNVFYDPDNKVFGSTKTVKKI